MKRILVIDDDSAVRSTFALALSSRGYEVETAEDGLSGLAAADRRVPDLVFLDLKMPGIDGVETLKRLGAAHPDVQVYVVTGFYAEFMEPLRRLKSSGIRFDVARKPLELAEIRAIADSVLAGTVRERSVALVGA
ncbi:MAG: response regulator [Alphaproteobacteria bacterium]|nr:response regulator [Alphaproteobacteria bacterium]